MGGNLGYVRAVCREYINDDPEFAAWCATNGIDHGELKARVKDVEFVHPVVRRYLYQTNELYAYLYR